MNLNSKSLKMNMNLKWKHIAIQNGIKVKQDDDKNRIDSNSNSFSNYLK